VNDYGTIPRTSAWQKNWASPLLNNFRQNVPGTPTMLSIGDPTAGVAQGAPCDNGAAQLAVDICNRGSAPIGANLPVGFYVQGSLVCSSATTQALEPGECESVMCSWATPPTTESETVTVDVTANDGDSLTECNAANNAGRIAGVYCQ